MLSDVVHIRTAAGILEIRSQATCRSFNTIFIDVFVITSCRSDDLSPTCPAAHLLFPPTAMSSMVSMLSCATDSHLEVHTDLNQPCP
jgi:hypothetical protein